MKNTMYMGVGAIVSALAITPASAQNNNPADRGDVAAQLAAVAPQAAVASDKTGGLADIVVTGRKRARAEKLQRTPLSITALGAADLQRSVVRDLVDIGRMTPNASLQSSAQRGVQNFSIRGTGVSGSTPSDEPAVGIFQDGVYWGSNYGALDELFDLEGVEILRGPQGTLFGRNVTGGAVTLRSARPTDQTYAKITLGLSNGLGTEASAVVNGAIVPGTLSGRIALLSKTNEGLFHDAVSNDKYGTNNSYVVRPSLKWTPAANFDLTILGEYDKQYGDPIAVRAIAPNNVPGGPATLAELSGFKSPADYFTVSPNVRGFSNIDIYFGMVEANWHVGPGVLTSVSGFRQVHSRALTDDDGAPVNGFVQGVEQKQHQYSEELRYAADFTHWLSATAGLYYFDQHFDYAETRDLNNHKTMVASRSSLANNSYAAFAEADLKIIPNLTATLGGRYTHEKKTPESAAFGQCSFNLTNCNFSTAAPYVGNNFSPKIGLSYQLDSNKLLFASATKGFRSGGFSLRGTPLATPYKAEKVTAYEVGYKSDLLDHHVRFNTSFYYNKFTNLQRTVVGVDPVYGIIQSVFNAASANIKGAEVELTVLPVTGLTLSGTYGYTDAKYNSFLGFANPGSLQFVRVPKNTANLAMDYETKLNNDKVGFHVAGNYSSRYFFDDKNQLFQPGYWLMDANVYYTLHNGLTLSVWSRNLTNTKYSTWGSTLGALGENSFPGDPRTYGLRMSATF